MQTKPSPEVQQRLDKRREAEEHRERMALERVEREAAKAEKLALKAQRDALRGHSASQRAIERELAAEMRRERKEKAAASDKRMFFLSRCLTLLPVSHSLTLDRCSL